MRTDASKKASMKPSTHDDQENIRNTRKTLKVLQQTADKENLIGRSRIDTKLANEKKQDVEKKKMLHKCVQTGEPVINVSDLTDEEPSADYWRTLAEKRQESLDQSLQENEKLKDQVECLKEENRICKEMLEESKHLVDVLQEMLADEATEDGNVEV